MTYFGVLATFVAPPLVVLAALGAVDVWRWLSSPGARPNWRPYAVVLAHVGLALVYTTPWDNYLVATGVWWYDPDLVTGITLGYVPIEEYTFFVMQTLLTGLWTVWLVRGGEEIKEPPPSMRGAAVRRRAFALTALGWAASLALLFSGWERGAYLALILSWALAPVLVQAAFGADILTANWRRVALAVTIPTVYLWGVDMVALSSGTWVVDPAQTTGLTVDKLPLEEMVFFLITNLLIAFGVTLMLSAEAERRAQALAAWLRHKVRQRRESPDAAA